MRQERGPTRAGQWRRRKKPTLFDPHEPPATPTTPSDLDARAELEEQQRRLKALDAGLAGLPDDVRQLLEMKHKRGLTCEQIAERTPCSPDSIDIRNVIDPTQCASICTVAAFVTSRTFATAAG